MSDGMGCKCAAMYEGECSCGADWRSSKEVELEKELSNARHDLMVRETVKDERIEQLAAQNVALRSALTQFLDQEDNPPEDTGEWREVMRVLTKEKMK